MKFGNPEEYAEYFAKYLNLEDTPPVSGMSDPAEYCKALQDNSYFGADLGEYTAAVINGMQNIPPGPPDMSLIDTSRFGKHTVGKPSSGKKGSSTTAAKKKNGGLLGKLLDKMNPLQGQLDKLNDSMDSSFSKIIDASPIAKIGKQLFGDDFNNPFAKKEPSTGGNTKGSNGPASKSSNPQIRAASEYANSRIGTTGYGDRGCTAWVNVYLDHANIPEINEWVPDAMTESQNGTYPYPFKDPSQGAVEGDVAVLETSHNKEDGPDHVVIADGTGGYWGNSSSRNQIVHADLASDYGADNIYGYIATGGDGSGNVASGQTTRSQADIVGDAGITSASGSGKNKSKYGKGSRKSKYGKGADDAYAIHSSYHSNTMAPSLAAMRRAAMLKRLHQNPSLAVTPEATQQVASQATATEAPNSYVTHSSYHSDTMAPTLAAMRKEAMLKRIQQNQATVATSPVSNIPAAPVNVPNASSVPVQSTTSAADINIDGVTIPGYYAVTPDDSPIDRRKKFNKQLIFLQQHGHGDIGKAMNRLINPLAGESRSTIVCEGSQSTDPQNDFVNEAKALLAKGLSTPSESSINNPAPPATPDPVKAQPPAASPVSDIPAKTPADATKASTVDSKTTASTTSDIPAAHADIPNTSAVPVDSKKDTTTDSTSDQSKSDTQTQSSSKDSDNQPSADTLKQIDSGSSTINGVQIPSYNVIQPEDDITVRKAKTAAIIKLLKQKGALNRPAASDQKPVDNAKATSSTSDSDKKSDSNKSASSDATKTNNITNPNDAISALKAKFDAQMKQLMQPSSSSTQQQLTQQLTAGASQTASSTSGTTASAAATSATGSDATSQATTPAATNATAPSASGDVLSQILQALLKIVENSNGINTIVQLLSSSNGGNNKGTAQPQQQTSTATTASPSSMVMNLVKSGVGGGFAGSTNDTGAAQTGQLLNALRSLASK